MPTLSDWQARMIALQIKEGNKYTIHSPLLDYAYKLSMKERGVILGDVVDMITGAIIVGPYCQWPKTEPRHFIVTVKE